MKNLSFRKFLVVAVVLTLLLIASQMIRGVVLDRIQHRDTAQQSIASALADPQTLAGPVLLIQYVEHMQRPVYGDQGKVVRTEAFIERREKIVLPDSLKLGGSLHNEMRYRGVFRVNTYLLTGQLATTLQMPRLDELPRQSSEGRVEIESARLVVAMSDPRGIRNLSLQQDGQALRTEAGTGMKTLSSGIHAPLPDPASLVGKKLNVRADLTLVGTDSFGMLPLARDTLVALRADWPHPSFGGRFLPVKRSIDDKGFEAEWQISGVASQARQTWENSESRNLQAEHFSVSLIDPVDIYSMSDRASKYAELFILLTLGAFLLFELLRRLRLHPLNYLMVGAALLMFFLLLLSLSEQIGFGPAYLAASGACVLLIGFYSAHLLRSVWLAGGFTLGLGALYGAIYVILLSEQNALLMGSLLLFALLACVMIGTRKVDWQGLLASTVPNTSKDATQAE
jgi:inner membrane protein